MNIGDEESDRKRCKVVTVLSDNEEEGEEELLVRRQRA